MPQIATPWMAASWIAATWMAASWLWAFCQHCQVKIDDHFADF